jgi:hypothetical protein
MTDLHGDSLTNQPVVIDNVRILTRSALSEWLIVLCSPLPGFRHHQSWLRRTRTAEMFFSVVVSAQ